MTATERIYNSTNGLARLAQIVRDARGNRTQRQFAEATGIAHGTIRRWELMDARQPNYTALEKLARFTAYTPQELLAIALSTQEEDLVQQIQPFRSMDEVMVYAENLSNDQLIQLVNLLFAKVAERLKRK